MSSWRASSLSAFDPAQKTSQSNTEVIALETRSTGSAPSVSRLPLGLAHNPLLTSPPQHHGGSIRGRHPNEPPGRLATALRKPAACIQPTKILGRFLAQDRRSLPNRARSYLLSPCYWAWRGRREVFRCVLGLRDFGGSSCPREP